LCDTFGAFIALDLDSLKLVASRIGNDKINAQVNLASKLLDRKVLQEEKATGKVRIINVRSGVADAVGLISQSSLQLPGQTGDSIGSGDAPTQLYAQPSLLAGQARIPYLSAKTVVKAADAVDLVMAELESVASSLGQYLGRALLNPILSTNSASLDLNSATTVTVYDRHAFRVGQLVDMFAASSGAPTGSRILIGKITNVAATSGIAGTLTFSVPSVIEQASNTRPASSTTAADGLCLVLHNSYGTSASATKQLFSISDAAGTSTSGLYGQTVSGADWAGNSSGSAAAITPGRLRDFMDVCKQRSGDRVHFIVMSQLQFAEFHEAVLANSSGAAVRMFAKGDEDMFGDVQDADLPFYGAKVISDSNCPNAEVYVLNKDHVKLGVWQPISHMNDEQKVEATETKAEYLFKMAGMQQLIVDRRNGLGVFAASAPS